MVDKATKRQGWSRPLLLLVLSVLLWAGANTGRAQDDGPRQRGMVVDEATVDRQAQLAPATVPGTGPQYGVGFMSAKEDPADAERYANALATGATWNRWPIKWFEIEQTEGIFEWADYDAAIRADLERGLNLAAILLGSPYYSRAAESPFPGSVDGPTGREVEPPPGLSEKVFTDGSDVPGPGKQINGANRWARFVYRAVDRYRPGGVLAQTDPTWPAGGTIVWEVWNEPDLNQFWLGTVEEYARLLKVGYLAARHADPQARVMSGGLAFFEKPTFYADMMAVFAQDPLAPDHDYFHDIVGIHNYFHSWASWYYTFITGRILDGYGLEKEIWLNESGVPVWNDYPGPVWDETSPYRATMAEQADFVVQSAFYATFAGADAIFHFQLYDGCGNYPSGTDCPPYESLAMCLADGNSPESASNCAGDAFGLFRNPPDAACFTQHPNPETPRPSFFAYQALTTYLQEVEPLWRLRPDGSIPDAQEWVAFYRPGTGERVLGLWARFSADETAVVPALGDSAMLVTAQGRTETITPGADGNYTLTLPGATNQNTPGDPTFRAIGGKTFMLVEKDEQPPVGTLSVAPFVEGGELQVEWSADDGLGGGVQDYTLTVAVNGGSRAPWLVETTTTSAAFPVTVGQTYTFHMVARDRAGNVSAQEEVTIVAQFPSEAIRLPVIFK